MKIYLLKKLSSPTNEDKYLAIAPGQNNRPISLLCDEYAEELTFNKIYLGVCRQYTINVTPFIQSTSEIRSADRIGVIPNHVLYMAMKLMRIKVRDSLTKSF